jgi:DNA-binding protein YbaB
MTTGNVDPGGFLDPDSARDYLRDWKSRIDRMASDTQAMSERLAALRVTAGDGDHLATVTIDSSGVLVAVEFSDRIGRVAPEVVSRAVLNALRTARLEVARLTREIVADTMGEESVVARTVVERMESRLADLEEGRDD